MTYQFILLTRSSCGHGQVENKKRNQDKIILSKEIIFLKSRETKNMIYIGDVS